MDRPSDASNLIPALRPAARGRRVSGKLTDTAPAGGLGVRSARIDRIDRAAARAADRQAPDTFGAFDAATVAQAIGRGTLASSIVDATQPDLPIIGVNRAFCELTGYEPHEIIGRNCRFLQGPETDRAQALAIRAGLADPAQEGAAYDILNYRRDGTPFWNRLRIQTVRDARGRPLQYFATQQDVTKEKRAEALRETVLGEMNHRIGNLFTVAMSVIYGSARPGDDLFGYRDKLVERISAIATAHAMIFAADAERVSVTQLVRSALDPDHEPRINLSEPASDDGDALILAAGGLNLTLMLHELLTNALKHGALSHTDGRVWLSWERRGRTVAFDWIETGGPLEVKPLPAADGERARRRGFGSSLIETFVRGSIRPDARFDLAPGGLRCSFDVDLA